MCANDGGSVSFGSAATTKIRPSAICTRMVSQGCVRYCFMFIRLRGYAVARLRRALSEEPRNCATAQPLRIPSRPYRAAALLPIGKPILVHIHVVELNAPQLLRE